MDEKRRLQWQMENAGQGRQQKAETLTREAATQRA